MDTLKKVGKWYLIKETVKRLFGHGENERAYGDSSYGESSFGHSTFSSKEPMKHDAYRKE